MNDNEKSILEVEEPSIEVVVRSHEQELAIISFFPADATEWDVVVGVSNTEARKNIQTALEYAARCVGAAAFQPFPDHDPADDAESPGGEPDRED